MPFVKLDCAILDSTVYCDRDVRDVFITALLMAEPFEAREPLQALQVGSLEPSGFEVPPGWYGLVQAAGPGIVARSGVPQPAGMAALVKLCDPEGESRSREWDGRRMARVNGGYIILNYQRYRDRDYGSAERMRRFRERKALRRNGDDALRDGVTDTRDGYTRSRLDPGLLRNDTQAEGEVREDKNPLYPPEGEARDCPEMAEIRKRYPLRQGAQRWPIAERACLRLVASGVPWQTLLDAADRYRAWVTAAGKAGTEYVQQAATFYGTGGGWRESWEVTGPSGKPPPSAEERAASEARYAKALAASRAKAQPSAPERSEG